MLLTSLFAPIGAAIGLFVTALLVHWFLDADDDWVERVRRAVWPRLDALLGRVLPGGYAVRTIDPDGYAVTIPHDVETVERLLAERLGARRHFMAAYKRTQGGRPSAGSWVIRDGLLAQRQLHVVLVAAGDATDVYAHEEFSSLHPGVAYRHYRGIGQDVAGGVERVRDLLRRHEISFAVCG